jgi:hypothetical protein
VIAMTAEETTRVLLDVWDEGKAAGIHHRARLLTSVAMPNAQAGGIPTLPVGRRDAVLLGFREAVFGPRINAVATCPHCRETVEIDFAVRDILVDSDREPGNVFEMEIGEFRVAVGLPTAEDLEGAARQPDLESSRSYLFDRCVTRVLHGTEPVALAGLPEALLTAVSEQMEQLDPQANVRFPLCCPACEGEWESAFDIVTFLWSEVEAWAKRTLIEVHSLAAAYGWTESEILGLKPWRRRFYLSLVGP